LVTVTLTAIIWPFASRIAIEHVPAADGVTEYVADGPLGVVTAGLIVAKPRQESASVNVPA
jgi:hypothetical protein